MKKILVLLIVLLIVIPLRVKAEEKEIALHLFYQSTCPHCHELIDYLDDYLADKPNLTLYKYEVSSSETNFNIFLQAQKLTKMNISSVPFLVIGNEAIIGYSKYSTTDNIKELIKYYQKNNYKDVIGEALGTSPKTDIEIIKGGYQKTYNLPLIGRVNPQHASLIAVAAVIGFVDGFNPCAMWILIFLITMLFNMKDRKKMWLLGITFLFTSAVIYGLLMLSWLGVAALVGNIRIIKIIIGSFAIAFGSWNVLRFFKTKDVGCEVVNTSKRKKIINQVNNIIAAKKLWIAVLGIIFLAISVNIIEVTCSLGLPVMFIEILNLNSLSGFRYGLYILIYLLFFLLDDLLVFFIAMKTLKITAISNKYAKYSHLIGGIIMFLIGILMIFRYEWLTFTFK